MTRYDRHCFDQLDDSIFQYVLLFIDRPSYFSIVMFANAVSLFCRSVGINGNSLIVIILVQHKRKLKKFV